jgi:arylsulfatase A-like enzyme
VRALAASLLLLACARPFPAAAAGAAPAGKYNVVLVLMETLRPDHLGCYGYGRPTSPNLDRLAAESSVFENAYAQSSQSLISAASVLTGLYPPSHGVVRPDQRLDRSVPTLAGGFKAAGYRTAAFTSGFFLNRGFGLDGGFDVYEDTRDFGTLADVVPGALAWLKANGDRRFFLVVHGYDAHAPYRAPGEFLDKFSGAYAGPLADVPLDYNLSDRVWRDGIYEDYTLKKRVGDFTGADLAYVTARYDGAVLYADSKLGELLSALDAPGLKESTVVIFAGSAGEALMEHGTIISSFHGGLYEEGIHVPLIARVPGLPARRVKATAQLVDIAPTALDLAGLKPGKAQGISLRPALEGKGLPERTVYAQTLSLKTGEPYVGIRKYPWKLLAEDGAYSLFDLAADPAERAEVSAAKPAELKAMKAALAGLLKKMPRRKARPGWRPLGAEAERMKALGYWWVTRPRVDYWSRRRLKDAGGD